MKLTQNIYYGEITMGMMLGLMHVMYGGALVEYLVWPALSTIRYVVC